MLFCCCTEYKVLIISICGVILDAQTLLSIFKTPKMQQTHVVEGGDVVTMIGSFSRRQANELPVFGATADGDDILSEVCFLC